MTSRFFLAISVLASVVALLGLTACQLASPGAVVKTNNVVAASAPPGQPVAAVDRAAPAKASSSAEVLWGEVPKQCT